MLQLSWRRMLLPHGKQMLKSFRKLIQLIRWVQAQAAKLPCPARPLTLPPLNSNYAISLAPSPLRPLRPLESVIHIHTHHHHHRSTVAQRSSWSGFSNLTHICRLPKFSEGYYLATATLATSTATSTRTATRATAATSNEATATAEATSSASAS